MTRMQRDLNGKETNGVIQNSDARTDAVQTSQPSNSIDVVIVGAGFSGVYLMYQLRKRNFNVRIVEAGSGLGGVWHWNRYPGARVDSEYPIYALSIPEVYKDWIWSSNYPDDKELRAYFEHIDKVLDISRDTLYNSTVIAAEWDNNARQWTVKCDSGRQLQSSFFIPCTGFAAKRSFPDWKGLDSFQGVIHHSSFWPEKPVDVKGRRCAVVGSGATGIQILQAWGHEVGDDGTLTLFQRTPNMACPMRLSPLTRHAQEKEKLTYPEMFANRRGNNGGYLYEPRPFKTGDQSAEVREALYEELWKMGGFRFHENNYFDMTIDEEANKHAYRFWRDHVVMRIQDPVVAELLAPSVPPHPFGAKRCSLERDFYEQFNKSNVKVVSIKETPIQEVVAEGIITSDGKLHKLDVIALATGFDALTGGLKAMGIRGKNGLPLVEKWSAGVLTNLGMTVSGFPNLFFTYGPQAPSAYSNGPSSVELQADWIVRVVEDMRRNSWTTIEAQEQAERDWKVAVIKASEAGLRHGTDSWYFGSNVPGKPREPLNFAGGLPAYSEALVRSRENNYAGFTIN